MRQDKVGQGHKPKHVRLHRYVGRGYTRLRNARLAGLGQKNQNKGM